jgi:hypothetical protein
MMVASWAMASTVTWLTFHEVLTFESLVFVVPMWLCAPIWARQKIARDHGLPMPRLF